MKRRVVAGLAGLFLLVAGAATAEPVRVALATPREGEHVPVGWSGLKVRLVGALRDGSTSAVLKDARGRTIDCFYLDYYQQGFAIRPGFALSAKEKLAPGDYVVEWRGWNETDQREDQLTFHFTVDPE